jgi:hypothetical protein
MTLILCATKEKAELVESSLQALVGSEQQRQDRRVEICLRTGTSIDKEKEVSVLIDIWIV